MKRILQSFIILLIAAFALPVFAVNYDYTATVHKRNSLLGNLGSIERLTTGVMFKVLTVDTNTAATITKFNNNAATAVTNPVTAANFASATVCDGKVQFRTTAASVDLIVTHATGGYSTVIRGFTPNDHTIIIDETPGIIHHGLVWYSSNDNTATSTGITFVPKTAILDVWVEQVVVDNTETLNVGTSDTAAGFRSAISLATAAEGFTQDTGFITGGSNIDFTPVTNYGSLLTTAVTGSDAVVSNGGNSRKSHFVNTAGTDDDLYYTESAGGDTAAGYIHYMFIRLR